MLHCLVFVFLPFFILDYLMYKCNGTANITGKKCTTYKMCKIVNKLLSKIVEEKMPSRPKTVLFLREKWSTCGIILMISQWQLHPWILLRAICQESENSWWVSSWWTTLFVDPRGCPVSLVGLVWWVIWRVRVRLSVHGLSIAASGWIGWVARHDR